MTTEPVINTAATQGLARVVTDLSYQVTPEARPSTRVELHELLALVETMRAVSSSKELDADIDRIQAAASAIDQAVADMADHSRLTAGLLDIDPAEVRERVRQAAFERSARESLAFNVFEQFQNRLATDAAANLLGRHCDAVVTKMRGDFDTHVKAVRAAHELGISGLTEAHGLIDNASAETIEAFRTLPRAVAGLDQIAGLRMQMSTILRYGPSTPPVAAFVTGVDALALQGAWNAWVGESEVVQYNSPYFGSTLTQVRSQRVGGAWLALVGAGYSLHLNTAAETDDVLTAAHAGGVS